MRRGLVILLILVAVTERGFAGSEKEKSALLLVPELIQIGEDLNVSVGFRWDEDAPLTLSTWSHGGRLSTFGDIRVFDELGKEVPMLYPMTMPLTPTGTMEVKKGELVKIGLYFVSIVRFQRAGKYCAVASFGYASSRGKGVRFTTKRRWFEVTSAAGKNL